MAAKAKGPRAGGRPTVEGREAILTRRKPKTPMRSAPGRELIRRYQKSGCDLVTFWANLSSKDRAVLAEELDQGALYNDLLEEAIPSTDDFKRVRKEFANLERIRRKRIAGTEDFDTWPAQEIARLCVDFYLRKRLAERAHAGHLNTGPRASRYVPEYPRWRTAVLVELRAHPLCEERQIIAAVKKNTNTKAASGPIRDWWRENEKTLRADAKVPQTRL